MAIMVTRMVPKGRPSPVREFGLQLMILCECRPTSDLLPDSSLHPFTSFIVMQYHTAYVERNPALRRPLSMQPSSRHFCKLIEHTNLI